MPRVCVHSAVVREFEDGNGRESSSTTVNHRKDTLSSITCVRWLGYCPRLTPVRLMLNGVLHGTHSPTFLPGGSSKFHRDGSEKPHVIWGPTIYVASEWRRGLHIYILDRSPLLLPDLGRQSGTYQGHEDWACPSSGGFSFRKENTRGREECLLLDDFL